MAEVTKAAIAAALGTTEDVLDTTVALSAGLRQTSVPPEQLVASIALANQTATLDGLLESINAVQTAVTTPAGAAREAIGTARQAIAEARNAMSAGKITPTQAQAVVMAHLGPEGAVTQAMAALGTGVAAAGEALGG